MKIEVTVKPGSTKGPLVEKTDSGLTVFLRERAVDGAANNALINMLAKHFSVSKSSVSIIRGHKSKIKLVEIVK